MPGALLYVAQISIQPATDTTWQTVRHGASGKSRMRPPLVAGHKHYVGRAAAGRQGDGKQSAWTTEVAARRVALLPLEPERGVGTAGAGAGLRPRPRRGRLPAPDLIIRSLRPLLQSAGLDDNPQGYAVLATACLCWS